MELGCGRRRGKGGRGNHSRLQEGGRRVSWKGEAGSGAEPQVGEERVFPVSHEVIHGESSDFTALFLCPGVDISGRATSPKGCLGNGKWGVLPELAKENRRWVPEAPDFGD